MKIAVSRAPVVGYSFIVEKDKDFEKPKDITEACLELEQALMIQPTEEDEKTDIWVENP